MHKPSVKDGHKVLFGKYSGTEVKLDGPEDLVVREDDIHAILPAALDALRRRHASAWHREREPERR